MHTPICIYIYIFFLHTLNQIFIYLVTLDPLVVILHGGRTIHRCSVSFIYFKFVRKYTVLFGSFLFLEGAFLCGSVQLLFSSVRLALLGMSYFFCNSWLYGSRFSASLYRFGDFYNNDTYNMGN